MIPPLDPFSLHFDSIEIDPARASAPCAFEHALALAAPSAAAPESETPGFYLLDDAGGRFVVDREMGVVSLKDAALLESERGGVHGVRLKVVEASGASYEVALQLRITGLVPQTVGGDEFALLPELTAAPIADLTPVTRIALAQPPPRPTVPWAKFSAWRDDGAAASIKTCGGAAYGTLVTSVLPAAVVDAAWLHLGETPPPPSGRNALWSI